MGSEYPSDTSLHAMSFCYTPSISFHSPQKIFFLFPFASILGLFLFLGVKGV